MKSEMNIAQALDICTQVTRTHSSTFYLGARLFPLRQRRAVMTIYAVCRQGDDAVDECATPEEGRRGLEAWWLHIEQAYAGRPDGREPLELGLAWVLENYEIPRAAFEELYLGLESDLRGQEVDTVNDLMSYCRRVAGVVGWMIASIAGYSGGEKTLLDALALGQAMQLTNILRDVGEDLEMGRCYLPRELLEKHGIDLGALKDGRVTDNYIALLEELMHLARRLYKLGWQGIPKLHGRAAIAVACSALSYEAILGRLAQNDYDNLTRRAHLKPLERLPLIPKAAWAVYGGRLGSQRHVRALTKRLGLRL